MVRDDGNQLRGKIMRGRGNETLIGLGKELLGIYRSILFDELDTRILDRGRRRGK